MIIQEEVFLEDQPITNLQQRLVLMPNQRKMIKISLLVYLLETLVEVIAQNLLVVIKAKKPRRLILVVMMARKVPKKLETKLAEVYLIPVKIKSQEMEEIYLVVAIPHNPLVALLLLILILMIKNLVQKTAIQTNRVEKRKGL
eukprot:UN31100